MEGADALAEIGTWDASEFAYAYAMRAPVETIKDRSDDAVAAAFERQRAALRRQTVRAATTAQKQTTADSKPAPRSLFREERNVGT